MCDWGTGAQQFRGLVMSEIHRRRPWPYKLEFSFVGNDRRPLQKSGSRRENRNAPDSPDSSQTIPDDRGYLRLQVFISRQTLGRSGNSKIPYRPEFSRDMKTRLLKIFLSIEIVCGVAQQRCRDYVIPYDVASWGICRFPGNTKWQFEIQREQRRRRQQETVEMKGG